MDPVDPVVFSTQTVFCMVHVGATCTKAYTKQFSNTTVENATEYFLYGRHDDGQGITTGQKEDNNSVGRLQQGQVYLVADPMAWFMEQTCHVAN